MTDVAWGEVVAHLLDAAGGSLEVEACLSKAAKKALKAEGEQRPKKALKAECRRFLEARCVRQRCAHTSAAAAARPLCWRFHPTLRLVFAVC